MIIAFHRECFLVSTAGRADVDICCSQLSFLGSLGLPADADERAERVRLADFVGPLAGGAALAALLRSARPIWVRAVGPDSYAVEFEGAPGDVG